MWYSQQTPGQHSVMARPPLHWDGREFVSQQQVAKGIAPAW